MSKMVKYPCYIRKCISKNILRFRTAVTRAIKHRKNVNESFNKKVEGIYYLKFNRNMIKCSINIPKNAPKNFFYL